MQNDIKQQATVYVQKRQKKQRWHQIVTCLAAIVVSCTTYALILPAITLESEPSSGLISVSGGDAVNDFSQFVSAGDEATFSKQTVSAGNAAELMAFAESRLSKEEYAQIVHIIDLIEKLPVADEADAVLLAYEDVEDWESYESYFAEVGYAGRRIYEAYQELNEEQKKYVYNIDKLMELSYIWSAATLVDEITSDSPTTVTATSTSEFIELNLYDYGSDINEKYSSNNKYPGFQWNGGAYLNGTYDRHKVDYIDFGNSMITDLTYGSSSGSALGKSANAQMIGKSDGSNGAINKLDVSDFGVTNRPIGMSLNANITDETEDVLSRTLGSDGYPALKDGSSLAYLFGETADNKVYAIKQNTESIDGLFQRNEVTGAYYFNSRENHAQYGNNKFTLYHQIITPSFIVYPFGNFLPLNDITDGSNATQVSRIRYVGGGDDNNPGYVQQIINDLIYASDYGSNSTKQQLLEMLVKYREDLKTVTTSGGTAWTTWNAKNAIVDYFTTGDGDNPSDDTSLITDPLLSKMYNIDWDVQTNFFFGMDMTMTFMQPKGGMTGNDTNQDGASDYPMVFYFTGDDDVWIYIDNVLFLDLSGIHRHVGGEIDFVKGEVHYYHLDPTNKGDVSDTPYKTYTFAELLAAAGMDTAGLNAQGTFKDYTFHELKFYYMERGSGSSVCRLNFNFPLLKRNSISVSKELTVDEQDKMDILGDPDFQFQILKADSNGNRTEELFVGAGVTYTLYAKDGTRIGDRTTEAGGVFTLKAGQRAEFSGIEENAGKYYVRELLDPAAFDQYGHITVDGSSTTVNNNVTVGEDTFTGVNSPVKDASDGTTVFHFNNEITFSKLGSLEIGKVLETYSRTGTVPEFAFYVTLDGRPLPVGTIYTVGSENKLVEAEGIVLIPAGSVAKINKIIAGTRFTVQETEVSAKGYTVTYSGGPGVTTDGRGAFGKILVDSSVQVTITNSENGTCISIPVTKAITNPDGSERVFAFALIQVADSSGETPVDGGISQMAEVKVTTTGEGTFTLQYLQKDMDASSETFYYKITENAGEGQIMYDNTVYVVEVTVRSDTSVNDGLMASITKVFRDGILVSGEGSSDADETGAAAREVAFANTLLGDLSLEKRVSGGSAEQEFSFILKLEVGESNLASLPTTYTAIFNHADQEPEITEVTFIADGTLHFSMRHGETLVIQGIPVGAVWTITETNADGYRISWKAEGGALQDTVVQDGNTIWGAISSGKTAVACTNAATYVLPDTGGTGSYLYTAGGTLMIMAACSLLLLINKKYFKGRGLKL